jgi:hypothetical protein
MTVDETGSLPNLEPVELIVMLVEQSVTGGDRFFVGQIIQRLNRFDASIANQIAAHVSSLAYFSVANA